MNVDQLLKANATDDEADHLLKLAQGWLSNSRATKR